MYYIIVNPSSKSGRAKSMWKELAHLLNMYKITYIVHISKSEKDLRKYVKSITMPELYEYNREINELIILGGDGTLNCVINSIADLSHTAIRYIPTGTSNDFARGTKLSCNMEEIVKRLKRSQNIETSDVGLVSYGNKKRRFAVSCGIGFDAKACDDVMHSPFKDFFNRLGIGKLIYGILAIRRLFTLTPVACDLYLDDKPPIHFRNFLFASFMQHPYEGGGFMLCPDANANDGLLEICVASNLTAFSALPIFPLALKGKHTHEKGIRMFRAKKVRIVTSEPLCVHTDGEICGYYKRLTLCTEENKLIYYQ